MIHCVCGKVWDIKDLDIYIQDEGNGERSYWVTCPYRNCCNDIEIEKEDLENE